MSKFSQRFMPYQFWRFLVINTRMYLISKGMIGPRHG